MKTKTELAEKFLAPFENSNDFYPGRVDCFVAGFDAAKAEDAETIGELKEAIARARNSIGWATAQDNLDQCLACAKKAHETLLSLDKKETT